MPSKVYNNVEDHRLLDGKYVVEDVTKVGLPTLKHTTTTISNIRFKLITICIIINKMYSSLIVIRNPYLN